MMFFSFLEKVVFSAAPGSKPPRKRFEGVSRFRTHLLPAHPEEPNPAPEAQHALDSGQLLQGGAPVC